LSQRGNDDSGRVREAELLAAVERVPALPDVVVEILGMVATETSSAGDLEALVGRDMVISGRLLKLVNSPFYGLNNQVSSITQAVALIGFASMRSLVLASSTAELLDASLPAYAFEDRGVWNNAMVTGALARRLTLLAGCDSELADEAFVGGLLRDVGLLIIGPFLQQAGVSLRQPLPPGGVCTAEQAVVGYDHCWAGERLAEKWQLPARLVLLIARHHRVPSAMLADDLRLLALVRLAERLVFKAGVGLAEGHPFDCSVEGHLVTTAGLTLDDLRSVIESLPHFISEVLDDSL
jgi:HD-like signal output (HDOD) protein